MRRDVTHSTDGRTARGSDCQTGSDLRKKRTSTPVSPFHPSSFLSASSFEKKWTVLSFSLIFPPQANLPLSVSDLISRPSLVSRVSSLCESMTTASRRDVFLFFSLVPPVDGRVSSLTDGQIECPAEKDRRFAEKQGEHRIRLLCQARRRQKERAKESGRDQHSILSPGPGNLTEASTHRLCVSLESRPHGERRVVTEEQTHLS